MGELSEESVTNEAVHYSIPRSIIYTVCKALTLQEPLEFAKVTIEFNLSRIQKYACDDRRIHRYPLDANEAITN